MKGKEDILIARLKAQVASGQSPAAYTWRHAQQARPPITLAELAHAESLLGFSLPPPLKRIYLEVGNGGFGPAYGLFKLNDESKTYDFDAIVQNYQAMRSMTQEDIDTYWTEEEGKPSLWPEKMIDICHWGCNIYSHIDCASPEHRVLRTEESLSEFAIEAPSFYQWLEGWLDGKLTFSWKQAEIVNFC